MSIEPVGAAAGLRLRGLIAAGGAAATLGATIGLAMPLFALALAERGWGEGLIGLSAAVQFAGIMGFAPLAPWAIRRLGLFRAILLAQVACAACLAAFPALDDYAAWLVLRLLFGGAEGLLFVASETWINEAADDRRRGRIVALYTTVLAAGFAIGPLVVAATGIAGALPFLAGAGLVLAGLVPLTLGLGAAPALAGPARGGVAAVLRALPVAALSAALFGLIDGGLVALLAVWGLAIGFATGDAARLVTALVVGGIVLQLPIGWLADRIDRTRLLAACCWAGAAILALLPAAARDTALLAVLLFLFGGLLGAYWMLAMTLLGERFRGPDLAAGNVALTLAYGTGSVAGPVIGGLAMQVWPPHGLMAALAALTAAAGAGALALGAAGSGRP